MKILAHPFSPWYAEYATNSFTTHPDAVIRYALHGETLFRGTQCVAYSPEIMDKGRIRPLDETFLQQAPDLVWLMGWLSAGHMPFNIPRHLVNWEILIRTLHDNPAPFMTGYVWIGKDFIGFSEENESPDTFHIITPERQTGHEALNHMATLQRQMSFMTEMFHARGRDKTCSLSFAPTPLRY